MKAFERLLKYVVVDTQSDSGSRDVPSTQEQLAFAKNLKSELINLGVEDAEVDEFGYLYGHIDATGNKKNGKSIGLIAHIDTAENFKGPNETPKVIKNYDGKSFKLKNGTLMDPDKDVHLEEAKGSDIIVTDGTTLLGGDDKAGLSVIMTVLEYFKEHPDVSHSRICLAFTPDEEIGTSQENFNTEKFDADFAYTLDGENADEIQYENFNAASAYVTVMGFDFHPGAAKNVMKPAAGIATEYNCMLPQWERPEHTEGYEGFYHLSTISGNEEKCEMEYLIREFDKDTYNKRKYVMEKVAELINLRYGGEYVSIRFEDSYKNMAEVVEKHMEVVDIAKAAIKEVCGDYKVMPIRGGTDGAGLSFKGVPCPNIGTGSYNHHSTLEFANVSEMDKLVEITKLILTK